MVKRILLGTLLVGLIGVLVAGAIIRTVDKTENVAEARGQGYGRGYEEQSEDAADSPGQGRGGYGQSARSGQGAEGVALLYQDEAEAQDWVVVEGTVVEAPESGGHLMVKTDDGQEIAVGTGPGCMESQGFGLEVGERVQVQGYLEGDEVRAAQVTRMQDGQSITLRDEAGRPAWAGSGRRALEGQAVTGEGGQGGGGRGGEGREDAPGGGTGTGQAQVEAWLTLQATVASVDSQALIVQTAEGQEIVVENRAWWFAQEQGFSAQVSDQVTLVGFYENDDPSTGSGQRFEVGRITNVTSGQSVEIREDNGRPLWAGRGRRGG
jgi:hypothetical protein